MTTKESVEKLTSELRNDPDFWESYKANIAMAFYDEAKQANWEYVDLHEVANKAAERFLNNWCN